MGEIILVKEGENFPSDILLLRSSIVDGHCFIETSSLDGEKNLKYKQGLSDVLKWIELSSTKKIEK